MKRFFAAETSAINLAVFRIILFFTLLQVFPLRSLPHFLWYSNLSRDLIVPPQGLGWLMPFIPINPGLTSAAMYLFFFFCITGLLGLFSRVSSWGAFLTGLYLLGVPQFFGKVNHCHHLLWFAALLGSSPCGDVLSVDFLWRTWKGKRAEAYSAYALTLRFAWILMGICYFFPGLWKLKTGGPAWIFSDNLKHILYYKWATLDGWLPFFRLDHYPFLYKAGAFAVVAFECSFIFLIFFPRLRWIAALGGIVFHEANKYFLHIDFWSLEIFYLTFIDWGALAAKFSFRNTSEMPVIAEGRNAYLKQIWITGIFLVAVNLFCGFQKTVNGWPFACYPTFDGISPLPQKSGIEIEIVSRSGDVLPFDERKLSRQFSPERLDGLVAAIIYKMGPPPRRKESFDGLIKMLRRDGFIGPAAAKIRFYRVLRSTVPEERQNPSLRRELLYESAAF